MIRSQTVPRHRFTRRRALRRRCRLQPVDRAGRGEHPQKAHEAGDAILAEFASVTDAVETAVAFQREMGRRNAGVADEDRLEFRVGVNLGEVIHDRDDIYGDGVNLAARIQDLAAPGGVCVAGAVYEQVQATGELSFEDMGHRKLKNIAKSVHVYALKTRATKGKAPSAMFFDREVDTRPVTTGGCLCGEIRFEVAGKDVGSSYCHCRICQRFGGAPLSAGTGFLYADFRVTRGEPGVYRSSEIAERAFCRTCGSSLWMKPFSWKWIFIKTANLDHPEKLAPTSHVGVESQLPWHDVHDDLRRRGSSRSMLSCRRDGGSSAWRVTGLRKCGRPGCSSRTYRHPRPGRLSAVPPVPPGPAG